MNSINSPNPSSSATSNEVKESAQSHASEKVIAKWQTLSTMLKALSEKPTEEMKELAASLKNSKSYLTIN